MTKKLLLLIVLNFSIIPLFSLSEKHILFISSYHPAFPTFFEQINGIKDTFSHRDDIVLDIEFMDSKRFYNEENITQFRYLLEYKIKKNPPYDIIITSDDNALNFVLKEQDRLFKNISIVFLGVNNIKNALAQNDNPYVTGVIEKASIIETIELSMSLHGYDKKLNVISDATPSGKADYKNFSEVTKKVPGLKVQILDLSNISFDELRKKLVNLGRNDPILLLSAYVDKNGKTLSFTESLDFILTNTQSPVYHLWFHGLGDGIVGGKLISHYEQGKKAAELVLNILDNKNNISEIKVTSESPNRYYFDYNVLQKYKINRKIIPQDSIIINQPETFYYKYKTLFWITTVFIFILILIISILIRTIIIRKRITDELAYLKNYQIKLFNSLDTIIISIDKDLKILSINFQGEKLFERLGADTDSIKNIPLFEDLYDDIQSSFKSNTRLEKKIISEQNIKEKFEVSILPFTSSNIDSVIIEIACVTEKLLLKEALIQSEKISTLGMLASGLTHELNNPLGSIIQLSQVIKNRLLTGGENNKEIKMYLDNKNILNLTDDIYKSGLRASKIIKNMLSFSRKSKNDLEEVNLSDIIDDAMNLLKLNKEGLSNFDFNKLIIEKNYNFNSKIKCDLTKIQQVFLNIFSNGLYAMTDSSDEAPKFIITITEDNNLLNISVKDNGPGIDNGELKTIFEPFYTTKPSGKGTGLGLSITKRIIEHDHNGSIKVESIKGLGTNFQIKLPINN